MNVFEITHSTSAAGPRRGILLGHTPTPSLIRPTVSCGPRYMIQPERSSGTLKRSRDASPTTTTPTAKLTAKPTTKPTTTPTTTEILSFDVASIITISPEALKNVTNRITKDTQAGRTLANFLNYNANQLLMLTAKNLRLVDEAITNKKGLTLHTSKGYKYIDGHDYAALAQRCAPDIVCSLAATTFVGAGNKRVRRSVDATIKYLDQYLSTTAAAASSISSAPSSSPSAPPATATATATATAVSTSSSSTIIATSSSSTTTTTTTTPHLFASIVGGVGHPRERQRSIEETLKRSNQIAGYSLAGFSLGETSSERAAVLATTVAQLPASAPRLLECVTDVVSVLDAVSSGMDLIAWTYPGK